MFLCFCLYVDVVILCPCVHACSEKEKEEKLSLSTWSVPNILDSFFILEHVLSQNKRSVLRDDHRRSPQRNLKEESEPIFSTEAVESGTHYDSL